MELEKACTVEVAAELLEVTPALVRRYCRQRRFKAEMFGGTWVIDKKSLAKFAENPRPRGRQAKSFKKRK